MNTYFSISLSMVLILISGCATTGKSTAAGAGIGAVAGGATGALADPGPDGSNRVRNVLIGSAIGAGVGALGGYFMGKHAEADRDAARAQGKKDAEGEMKTQLEASDPSGGPKLLPAVTEARWVPDAVKGGTFVPGHFEYIIVSPARWQAGR